MIASLAHERATLFRTAWQLVGFRWQLARDGDYVSARLGDRSVVVRSFAGELRAFHDVCAHRGTRMHATPSGNGPFRCPYHAWTYDREGCPVGIPHRTGYGELTNRDGSALGLARCSVEVAGHLVFARFAVRGPALGLADSGPSDGRVVEHSDVPIARNWREVVEDELGGGDGFVFPTLFVRATADSVEVRRVLPVSETESLWSCDRLAVSGQPLVATPGTLEQFRRDYDEHLRTEGAAT